MSEVISVDFNQKKRIDSYKVTIWKCVICNKKHEQDSRKDNNLGRILLRHETKSSSEECVCRDCGVGIFNLVEQQGWNNV